MILSLLTNTVLTRLLLCFLQLVTLVSNVLRKNSAAVHQALATDIHRLIEARHEPSLTLDAVAQGAGSTAR